MRYCYDIYIGNLPTTVSTEQLKDLFSQVGEVVDIWINPRFNKITYGFVKFDNVISAEDACEQFNGQYLDSLQIKVRISEQTKRNLQVKSKIKSGNSLTAAPKREGILLELSKKTGVSKSCLLSQKLHENLRKNKEIVLDFAKACLEAENITSPQKFEIVKTDPEPANLTMLETTVLRYFRPTIVKKNTLKVDFDLSKGKHLTTEQYDKFFNLKLTKPRPVTEEQKTMTRKPYALDYRSVCD